MPGYKQRAMRSRLEAEVELVESKLATYLVQKLTCVLELFFVVVHSVLVFQVFSVRMCRHTFALGRVAFSLLNVLEIECL